MSYQQRLEEIRQRFLTSIPERLDAIEALLQDAVSESSAARDEPVATELHRRCHDLAGSSSMLGARELGGAAHEMMAASREASLTGRRLTHDETEAFGTGFAKLRAAAAILRANAAAP
jgi:HPt (histidine-containing phosphotransfer) domain-containing protein